MAKLTPTAIVSLDGYVADTSGKFDWAVPDEKVHAFMNDLERPIGTCLMGRRLYEVMAFWETVHNQSDYPTYVLDYAKIWRSADKIAFSKTLESVSSSKTRIERDFDPEIVRQMKAAAKRDLSVGGPNLAAKGREGWIDRRVPRLRCPDNGRRRQSVFPSDVRVTLDLLDECRFDNGMVHLRYGTVK